MGTEGFEPSPFGSGDRYANQITLCPRNLHYRIRIGSKRVTAFCATITPSVDNAGIEIRTRNSRMAPERFTLSLFLRDAPVGNRTQSPRSETSYATINISDA